VTVRPSSSFNENASPVIFTDTADGVGCSALEVLIARAHELLVTCDVDAFETGKLTSRTA
jgi:hypothetical protein